jgi:hypothetical protein
MSIFVTKDRRKGAILDQTKIFKHTLKRILLKSLAYTLATVLVLLPLRYINGCGHYVDFEASRMVFFDPQLQGESAMSPFVFSFDYLQPETGDPEKLDYQQNCREWAVYLGDVSEEEVFQVIYEGPVDRFLSSLETGQLDRQFPGNRFVKKLQTPAHKDALDYLTMAFKAEFSQFANQDPWGFGDSNAIPFGSVEVLDVVKEKLKTLQDPFLRQRYAYQQVVHARYLQDYSLCIDTYDQFFGETSSKKSIVAPWGLLHKAYAVEMLGDTVQSNLLLSQVFDQCHSKKVRAVVGFYQDYRERTLELAKTPEEKALVNVLSCMRQNGPMLSRLRQIAEWTPQSPYWPQLLSREINKMENWLLTPELTFFSANINMLYDTLQGVSEELALSEPDNPYQRSRTAQDLRYLGELQALVEKLLPQAPAEKRDFMHLAAAHLAVLAKQPARAEQHLNAVKAPAHTAVAWQRTVQDLLLLPQLLDITTAAAKTQVLDLFKQLRESKYKPQHKFNMYAKLELYYSRLYHRKGDLITAALLYNRCVHIPVNAYRGSKYYKYMAYFDRYASLEQMDQLLALLGKKDHTPFEQFLLAPLNMSERPYYFSVPEEIAEEEQWWYGEKPTYGIKEPITPSREQLLDLKGTIALRQHNLPVALAAFQQLPPTYWDSTYAFRYYLHRDPFVDTKSMAWESPELTNFSKAVIVEEWIKQEAKAKQSGQTSAEAHYLLANLAYNISYWGNSWMMFSYGKTYAEFAVNTGGEYYSFHPNARKYFNEYYNLSEATKHYLKALSSSKDPELNALCMLMLGQCEQKQQELVDMRSRRYWWDDDPEKKKFISPQFREAQRLYGETEAFQQQLLKCPELDAYFEK